MTYVLLTAAKNEQDYIEKTLRTVVAQTVLPAKWIIVSDGSVDNTDAIVRRYAMKFPFIQLVRRPSKASRDFAAKVHAINTGLQYVKHVQYDFIGNLDADVSFPSYYYESILKKFSENPKIGIAGGILYDKVEDCFHRHQQSLNSVGGPIQCFRKSCFEQIGGYPVLSFGSEDGVAEVTARMYGWEVVCFPELKVLHHRQTGSEGKSSWAIRWNEGLIEYMIGYHPIFHLARGLQRLFQTPVVLGSLLRSLRYVSLWMKQVPRPVSDAFVFFIRKEEMAKLRSLLKRESRC